MSEQSHRGTFEVGPSGHVNGERVQLVYASVRERHEPLDYTYQALRAAVDAGTHYFGRDSEHADEFDARNAYRAEKFLAFLRSEDREPESVTSGG